MEEWRISTEKQNRKNAEIRVPRVRVIDAEGENIGVLSRDDALRMAEDAGLDLVEIQPNADPPVCRVMDFGRFKFEAQKKANIAKKKQKQVELKELKFRPTTDEGDYQVKMRNLRRFIEEGDKVKITIRFRGREMAHQDLGLAMARRIAAILLLEPALDDCYAAAKAYSAETGAPLVPPFDHEDIIEGQASVALEMIQQLGGEASQARLAALEPVSQRGMAGAEARISAAQLRRRRDRTLLHRPGDSCRAATQWPASRRENWRRSDRSRQRLPRLLLHMSVHVRRPHLQHPLRARMDQPLGDHVPLRSARRRLTHQLHSCRHLRRLKHRLPVQDDVLAGVEPRAVGVDEPEALLLAHLTDRRIMLRGLVQREHVHQRQQLPQVLLGPLVLPPQIQMPDSDCLPSHASFFGQRSGQHKKWGC